MYIDICTNYPLCDNYTYDNIDELIKPISINSQSTYILKNIQKYSPMDKNQYVIIVKCDKSEKIKFCGFNLVFNTKNNSINLNENEIFSRFIKKEENDLYKIDYEGQKTVEKILIDLMVFSGDIIFNLNETRHDLQKLFYANKISYIVTLNRTLPNITNAIKIPTAIFKNTNHKIPKPLVPANPPNPTIAAVLINVAP